MTRIDIRRLQGTRAWRNLSRDVCRAEPRCWLKLPGCTGRSTTMDHIICCSIRPDLALARANVRGACRWCNDKRGDTPVSELPKLRAILEERAAAGEFNAQPRRRRQTSGPAALSFFKPTAKPMKERQNP